jgi:UDP-2,3-diacylglucosamine pyrophosphatase LpxH
MNRKAGLLLFWIAAIFLFGSCKSNSTNPFDTMGVSSNDTRDKIVVISDLHLGSDLSFSENVKHLQRLEQFLNEIRLSSTVKELIIGGDMIDEWYIPTRSDTYGEGTQADFVRKTVAANQGVFDVLNGIITDGNIKVTYLPGNHDMGFTPENIEMALPGINQARDAGEKFATGTYYPEGYPQVAIEHGHRYDFFCSMTPNAIEDAPESFFAPGYFFARIAANSFTDPTTQEEATKVGPVTLNDSTNPEQYSKYVYYSLWKNIMENVIYVKDDFNEPIIKTNIGGLTKTYSINDIIPMNSETDGSIQMKLYNNLFTQANWEARQLYNNVRSLSEINAAMVGSLQTVFIDERSNAQYFQDPDSDVRVVVFGHTHIPMIKTYLNSKGDTCLYANSGTWEDKKSRDKNANIDQDVEKMDFVTIVPVKSDKNKLQVGLFQYQKGKHVLKDSKEVEL